MKAPLHDKSGKVTGEVQLPIRVFSREWNPDLVHQALRAQEAGRRKVRAHTKDRGDVRGGGKKPWAQKHTGRARHGSIRSPIWKGGGVVFGPRKNRNFEQKINKKMRQAALFSLLSRQLHDGVLKIVDSLELNTLKTKDVIRELAAFLNEGTVSTLIVPNITNKTIYKSAANIKKTKAVDPRSLNVYDLLRFKQILLDQKAIEVIDGYYKKLNARKS
ncbi:MAG: 50S ribosomal protein L4 [Candidatus Harrisonbacteria bacterium RIFOXYD1_FULL_40_9]|uniref:Large ribosomal subunit protein uL4 n=1 Tax=Candidatus Harrisonbacteria bacterium RIFOXYD1_FULL_40_9 TaxID=1798412 RepID=A0A1G1ZYB5_9BACT|nr:MAG: 50S ribosomal protein L4 [Candidatus Harrisonbacteria bacterium RIFOXYD1_FULL_40_9]